MPATNLEKADEKFFREKAFDVTDGPDGEGKWLVRCKKCKQAWSLTQGPLSVGNKLHLLNHANSHRY